MRKGPYRITLLALALIAIAFLVNQYFIHFTGDGKKTPEEALPTDNQYEWIDGPKTENEQRFFFLSNKKYFGTSVVTKNLKGWSAHERVSASLPNPLEENKVTQAFSDQKIIYGLVKLSGEVKVDVNGVTAELIDLNSLSEDVLSIYNVNDYSIWYVQFSHLENHENFTIKLINSNNETISELSI